MVQLSQSNETFCQRLFITGDQPQSYLDAGHKCKDLLVASAAATRLLKDVNIRERMAELNKPQAERAGATIDERRELLSKFANEDNETDKGNIQRSGNIAAIAELNKMDGAYEPEKLDIRSVNVHVVGYKRVERKD